IESGARSRRCPRTGSKNTGAARFTPRDCSTSITTVSRPRAPLSTRARPSWPASTRCDRIIRRLMPCRAPRRSAASTWHRVASTWARSRGVALSVLGGGSNLVVGDAGVDGLVVRVGVRGIETADKGHEVLVSVGAGEPWDPLVAVTVECGWAGLECLSGIPGLVGATPIQNVGAYGQEVAETLVALRALDTRSGRVVRLTHTDCRFAYRDSLFKSGEPGRFIVLDVTYRLRTMK